MNDRQQQTSHRVPWYDAIMLSFSAVRIPSAQPQTPTEFMASFSADTHREDDVQPDVIIDDRQERLR